MKNLCYLLSLLFHGLVLLAVLLAEFPITIQPGPPRLTVVRIAEPPLPFVPELAPLQQESAAATAGARSERNGTAGPGGGPTAPAAGSRLLAGVAGSLRLGRRAPGSFRLAPVGRSPEPWALPKEPAPPSSLALGLGSLSPGSGSAAVREAEPFRLSFDVRERVAADWTEAALARIERNWIIPASGRLAFAGRVQITLTVGRQGGKRSLTVDDSDLPELLTLAALHAVEASLPLPPLPDQVAGEAFTFTFVFHYNG